MSTESGTESAISETVFMLTERGTKIPPPRSPSSNSELMILILMSYVYERTL